MINGEWRLRYPGTEYAFGPHGFDVFNRTTPEPGTVDDEVGDAPRPFEDGVNFGTDTKGGRLWSFDLGVSSLTSEADVRARVGAFRTAWRADIVRGTAGMLAELHTCYRGVERVMYGRPRRADPVYANTSATLTASIVATFQATDDVHYDTTPTTAVVGLVGEDQGGLIAPLRAPLSTTGTSDRSVFAPLVTEVPAWPVITITGGQVTNPVVEAFGRWRIGLRGSFAYDDTIVIDTRPWKRTILRNGFSIAGALDANSTRLARCGTASGLIEVGFNAQSVSNTATARIDWTSGYSAL